VNTVKALNKSTAALARITKISNTKQDFRSTNGNATLGNGTETDELISGAGHELGSSEGDERNSAVTQAMTLLCGCAGHHHAD